MFLYCYFVDFPEHVNLWLVAQGDEPIDFGMASNSQTSDMKSHMNDLSGEQSKGGSKQQVSLSKLSGFAKELDGGHGMSYNNGSGGGSSSQQSSSSSGGSSVDIGEINPSPGKRLSCPVRRWRAELSAQRCVLIRHLVTQRKPQKTLPAEAVVDLELHLRNVVQRLLNDDLQRHPAGKWRPVPHAVLRLVGPHPFKRFLKNAPVHHLVEPFKPVSQLAQRRQLLALVIKPYLFHSAILSFFGRGGMGF